MKIAVIGAGNCGQALSSVLASHGHEIRLFNRSLSHLNAIANNTVISCFGALSAQGKIALITNKIGDAVKDADIIFVTTTADVHKDVANLVVDYLENEQIVLLYPGRTGGALEFREVLRKRFFKGKVYIAEAQSFIYACRIKKPGCVHIIGEKGYVPVAAYPSIDIITVINRLKKIHQAFAAVENVLQTSFQNVGAIFHPGICLFNAAAIERGAKFFFYRDISSSVAQFISQLDLERLSLGKAYGISLLPIMDWIVKAYPDSCGDTLCELMQSNPAYFDICAPTALESRYLLEDIPTGIVPFISFGEAAGIEMPLFRSLVHISSVLLKRDFFKEGRTLEKMGFAGKDPKEILESL